jgi:signal transduction histidine kinase
MKPIKQMTAAARKMAHGQMDVRVDVDDTDTAELNELALAFNNMAQALAKSEQKRQEFVANVSHELKTPMTTISGYMEGMLDGTIPPEQQPKYMEIIAGEVKRLSRLVRSMLDISRLQDQRIPAERKRVFDVCQTLGEVLISFEQKINGKGLEVETELPDQGARVNADPDAITQVVYNLIDNAVKFCPQGGTLGLKVDQTKGSKYLISVRNTGPTIPAEELPLVFDRFHKTDKSRSVDRDGWGLGLYIVKTIILSHEEDIYVTSRDGVTEFSFTMPRVSA